ncbi:hypothetical protein ACHAPJ_012521, partial [Fusarium lateritium]
MQGGGRKNGPSGDDLGACFGPRQTHPETRTDGLTGWLYLGADSKWNVLNPS